MSSDHESSYYEIALTNRQVLTIFVVLLTCLVAAFLSGVWIGRGDGGEGLPQSADTSPPAEAATAQMTELNFFSEGAAGGDRAEEEPSAPKRRRRQEQQPPPEPAGEEPPGGNAPQEPATQQPAATPAATPAAVNQRPAATPAAASAPDPAAQAGRVIQVFSTLDLAQAEKLVERLSGGGYPAYLVEENLQGRTTYRVRVGPYQQDARAQQVAEELKRQYRLDTWITSQPG